MQAKINGLQHLRAAVVIAYSLGGQDAVGVSHLQVVELPKHGGQYIHLFNNHLRIRAKVRTGKMVTKFNW